MWKTSYAKAFFLGLSLTCIGVAPVFAQSGCSYQIITSGNQSLVQLTNALDNAKLDSFRKRTLQRTLHFDQGAEVILFSGMELAARGCPVNLQHVMPDNTPVDVSRIFTVHPSGVIMEQSSRPVKD